MDPKRHAEDIGDDDLGRATRGTAQTAKQDHGYLKVNAESVLARRVWTEPVIHGTDEVIAILCE
jgi:hypothetical protein